MFKIDIYGISIIEYPKARRRGKSQVYTGKINHNGKEDYEEKGALWFETREEAKAALCDYFAGKVAMYESNVARSKKHLERANNL
jgi:hypothetical protein